MACGSMRRLIGRALPGRKKGDTIWGALQIRPNICSRYSHATIAVNVEVGKSEGQNETKEKVIDDLRGREY